jgi:thiosulfate/3-mercaptopyruvate sulfurtransferase
MSALSSPLVSASALERMRGHGTVVLDVRWDLASGSRHDLYEQGHIPTAVFVDLDTELAAPAGEGGRHPLPAASVFEAAMRAAGVSAGSDVIVYDACSGVAAARAWWLLRYFGHRSVALLDGGLEAWRARGLPEETGAGGEAPRGDFSARAGSMPVLDADGAAGLAKRGVLLDARAAERFSGSSEPIDPVGGHIPGAQCRPTEQNLTATGAFLEPGELGSAFEALGIRDGVEVGVYCGSGVTAAHQILALELAGQRAALYPGSWSEWITDPARAVATGDE